MNQDIKMIVNPSLHVFMHEFQEAVQQGYEIDQNNPPTMFGICYEVGVVRTDKTAAKMLDKISAVVDGQPPKPTRAEILQKARDSRSSVKVKKGESEREHLKHE